MNKYQKFVLILGLILLFTVLLFFTPYIHILEAGSLGMFPQGTSYGSIFSQPSADVGYHHSSLRRA